MFDLKKLISKAKSISRSTLGVVLSLCMMAVMLPAGIVLVSADAWDGTSSQAFANLGTSNAGTAANPYQIANAAQLKYLEQNIASYNTKHFVLVDNIDLGNHAWTPIGVTKEFKGTFDGGDYVIRNANIAASSQSTSYYVGLFARASGATFRNLHVEGTINDTWSTTGYTSYVGGLAAFVTGTVKMQNCSFDGTITIASSAVAVNRYVGGLIGWSSGGSTVTLEKCVTSGAMNLNKKGKLAGLVGIPYSTSTLNIQSSYSTMDITTTYSDGWSAVGGFVAAASAATVFNIKDSFFAGSVNSPYPFTPVASTAANWNFADDVYFISDYYTGTTANATPSGAGADAARQKTVEEFANGTVASLLNTVENGTVIWTTGADGYPVYAKSPELLNLSASYGTIAFDSAVKTYIVRVPNNITSVTVTPTAKDGTAVKVNGQTVVSGHASEAIALTENATVRVEVKISRDGIEDTYTVDFSCADMWDGTVGTAFAGGEGTVDSPYEIATAEQLAYMAAQVNAGVGRSAYYVLTADMDLGDVPWTSIGVTKNFYFYGNFDGRGHVISGLYAVSDDSSNDNKAGLFGVVGTAIIKNLEVRGVVNASTTSAGGIVGYAQNGTLTMDNVGFRGSVSVTSSTGEQHVGGLVGGTGSQSLIFTNCYATGGTVRGNALVGGLVGSVNQSGKTSRFTNCWAGMSVDASSYGAGGLFGMAQSAGNVIIEKCYTTADASIKGTSGTAGLFGRVQAPNVIITINDSYSAATINTNSPSGSGGLFGSFNILDNKSEGSSATITNSYFYGTIVPANMSPIASADLVTAQNVYYREGSYNGNLVGVTNGVAQKTETEFADGTVTALLNNGRTIWVNGTKSPTYAIWPELLDLSVSNGTLEFDANLKDYAVRLPNTITSVTVTPTVKDGTAVTVNGQAVTSGTASQAIALTANATVTVEIKISRDGINDVYTVSFTCAEMWDGTIATSFAGGSGTETDPYLIETPAQLAYMAAQVNSGVGRSAYYKLTKDIDLGDRPWTAIAFKSDCSFSGYFDGDKHVISGLYATASGLFGVVTTATFKDLEVRGVVAANKAYAGGIIGYAQNGTLTMDNVGFRGSVSVLAAASESNVGGLVGGTGSMSILLNECYATGGTVSGNAIVGGLLGSANASEKVIKLTNCWSGMSVAATSYGSSAVIGMVQSTGSIYIDKCYVTSDSNISGTTTGGLLGRVQAQNVNLVITDSYVAATLSTTSPTGSAGLFGGFATHTNSSGVCHSRGSVATLTNCFFAGTITTSNVAPITNNYQYTDGEETVILTRLNNVYYREGSYTGNLVGLNDGATQKSATEFADGTVKNLLNAGGNVWSDGTDGHPIHTLMPKLTGLSVSCGTIKFNADVRDYSLIVPTKIDKTTVTVSAKDHTTITVNGTPLANGATSAAISLASELPTVITVVADRNGVQISYVITITRSATVWDGTYELPTNYNETSAGTVKNPYQIGNVKQLALLAAVTTKDPTASSNGSTIKIQIGDDPNNLVTFTRGGYGWFANNYFVLTDDIDLSIVPNWTPIGVATGPFSAKVFDGQGHTITGLNVDSDESLVGLFGNFYSHSPTIQNLNVVGNVTSTHPTGYVGGLVGRSHATNLVIKNCTFTGNVTHVGNQTAGGLIGRLAPSDKGTHTIESCSFNGNVITEGGKAGGLLGQYAYNDTILNVTNSYATGGQVKGSNSTGGLISYSEASKGTINIANCWSDMVINATNGGGFIGYVSTALTAVNITNSHFAGTVASQPIMNEFAAATLNGVYYKADSYTAAQAAGTLNGATEKTVDEFENGTVKDLLNSAMNTVGGFGWQDNSEKGCPVIGSVKLPLESITLSDGKFTFVADTFVFAETPVGYSVSKIAITPKAGTGVAITVNGETVKSGSASSMISLDVGVNLISIVLTKGNDTVFYVLPIVRREQLPDDVWDGGYEPFDASGDKGSDLDNPILIENASQFAFLAAMANGETVYYKGQKYEPPTSDSKLLVYADTYFEIAKDFKLNPLDDYENWETTAPLNNWTPIGFYYEAVETRDSSRIFAGTIDGKNHTISGMYCVTNLIDVGTGMFGATVSFTLRNLHVDKSYVQGNRSVGGLIGRPVHFNNLGLKNTLQNCSYSGTVKATNSDSRAGGIAGRVYPSLTLNSCWTEGKVIGGDYLGGLVGWACLYKALEVFNCYSTMEIISSKADAEFVAGLVGGIIKNTGSVNMRRSYFAGSVPTNKPIIGNREVNTTYTIADTVYFLEGSYVGELAGKEVLLDAQEKTAEEFANGTVTELLNNAAEYGDFWNWKDGENGLPVSDGILLVTDYKTHIDDSNFTHDTSWADKFVNKDGGKLKNPNSNSNNNNNSNDDSPVTGEVSMYFAVIVLLLISAVSVFFLRKKRSVN